MEELLAHFNSLQVVPSWKEHLNNDLCTLSHHYAQNFFESIAFVPYEDFTPKNKALLIEYLTHNNHARDLLAEKIKKMYPDLHVNNYDVDSIMDYYICSLQLID